METTKLSEFIDLLNKFELAAIKQDLRKVQKARMELINFVARLEVKE